MNPISTHLGGASIGTLGEREALMRDMLEQRVAHAMTEELPLEDVPEGARIFRIPKKTGYTIVYDQKRQVTDNAGNIQQQAEHKTVKFKPSAASGTFGQCITKDKRQIEVILKHAEDRPWLGIVDWQALRVEHDRKQLAEDAARLADPSYAKKVLAEAKRLGVNLAEGFGAVLRGGGNQQQQPAGAGAEK